MNLPPFHISAKKFCRVIDFLFKVQDKRFKLVNMKPLLNLALCTISTFIFLVGCSESCEPYQKELLETKTQLQQRDSLLNAIGSAFRIVDSNLVTMRTVEGDLVHLLKNDRTNEAGIRENIGRLKHVMAMNQSQLDQLRSNLTASSRLSGNLLSIVNGMEEKIVNNNLRLVKLNDNLGALGTDFKDVFADYLQSEQIRLALETNLEDAKVSLGNMDAQIRELSNNLNTAYVAIGTKRELVDAGILEKGGLLKQGSVNEDLDQMAFKPYDMRELKELSLGSGKARIITEHPSESYVLKQEQGKTVLHIESPKNFWRLSKLLIVIRD